MLAMNPEGAVGEFTSCPNCGGLSFELFEDVMDIDGNIAVIEICQACSALVNRAALERLQKDTEAMRQAQVLELHDVYPSDPNQVAFGATLEEEVPHFRSVIDFFVQKTGQEAKRAELVSAELGIGRGTLLRASAQSFARCYGTDIDFTLFDKTKSQLPVPDNVILLESVVNLPEPVDVILAWHTFEHVPRLHDLVATARRLLKPAGHIFFQVPLYRPENVVESHYTFMNRRSVAVLAAIEGFDVVDIWTDHNRHFLTTILRRSAGD